VAFRYDTVVVTRAGHDRVHPYTSDAELGPGDVVTLEGRWWLIERVEDGRAFGKVARYRVRLRHPDGREELGAFRRFRPGAPDVGHMFATLERGAPVNWEIVERLLARDDDGEPYLDLVAERDYGEVEGLIDHELEHALEAREERLPAAAADTLARAEQAGLEVELVALDAGEEADWDEAERYIDALIIEEIEDDLLEQCGVHPDRDPRDTWLDTVKQRLRSDLAAFRADVEGDRDEIEEWEFLGGRVFASVGSFADESNPNSGHGWMCRLVDSGALAAAGFERVRKSSLLFE
jgi:hypothetical protein